MNDKEIKTIPDINERVEAIYARQSLEKKDSISIEGQIKRCKAFAENPDTVRIYEDKGYSGKNIRRPGFSDLLRDVRVGKIKKIIIYRLDRMTRSLLDFENLWKLFDSYGVSFESTSEKLDTTNPTGEAMIRILMIFAQLERETIQQRMRDNYYQRGEKGMYLGGPPPFGFERVTSKARGRKETYLKPIQEQTSYIASMYEKYGFEEASLSEISQWLNEMGMETAKGTAWDSGKVSRLLRNPAYVKADADVYSYFISRGCNVTNDLREFVGTNGCYLYGKREANQRKYTSVKDHYLSLAPHFGLVDSDLWLRCQAKLDRNSQIGNAGQGKHSWLSGLVKCGKCDYCMTVTRYKDYRYFRCRGQDLLKKCTGQEITQHADKIENAVSLMLKEKVKSMPKVEMAKKSQAVRGNHEAKIRMVELEGQINKLLDRMMECDGAAVRLLNDKVNKLSAELEALARTVAKEIEDEVENPYEKIIELADNWEEASFEEKKLLARLLIEKVKIKDYEIDVTWRI